MTSYISSFFSFKQIVLVTLGHFNSHNTVKYFSRFTSEGPKSCFTWRLTRGATVRVQNPCSSMGWRQNKEVRFSVVGGGAAGKAEAGRPGRGCHVPWGRRPVAQGQGGICGGGEKSEGGSDLGGLGEQVGCGGCRKGMSKDTQNPQGHLGSLL